MKKILGVLFALVLAVSLILVPATVSTAATVDYNAAVIKAADRLVEKQNADGGFMWELKPEGAASAPNCLGITAMGILKGHELDDKSAYEIALAKAYKYAVDTEPVFTLAEGKWTEPYAVDRFPDITFLIGLANAASSDSSLLTAIQGQVSGTTPADIATLAKTRWDDRVNHLGDTTGGDAIGTATAMAEYIRDVRLGCVALIPWDLEAAVKAALALDVYYSGQGYATQATDIAEVLYASVDGAGSYFSSTDTGQCEYVLGLTGAIEAFQEVGLYPGDVTTLKGLLIDIQEDDGSWKLYGGNPYGYGGTPVDYSVQSTAYAVMALLKEGGADAVVAAQKGVDWLVLRQKADGGWLAEGGIEPEYLEMDSEAAWAIKTVLDISSSVGMVASYTAPLPPEIGISVTPTSINFGAVEPGVDSGPQSVTVTNTGNVDEDFSASITNESPTGVYTGTPGLTMDTGPVASWLPTGVAPAGFVPSELILTVPGGTAPGTYTATLVFWAEAN